MIKSYRDLIVWQKSMTLAVEIYLGRRLPTRERFGFSSQLSEPRFRYPQTSPRGIRGEAAVIFAGTSRSLVVRWPRWRLISSRWDELV
jgi:hypothetical protein